MASGILSLGEVLGRMWPPDRVVLGRRVCWWLHDTLLQFVADIELVCALKDPGLNLLSDLQRLKKHRLSLQWSSRMLHGSCCGLLSRLKVPEIGEFGKAVKSMDLTSSQLGMAVADDLAELLPNLPLLSSLILDNNPLQSEGMTRISRGLGLCTALTRLSLNDAWINNDGAASLAGVLPACTAIADLSLQANFISVNGARALAMSIRFLPVLSSLNLRGNRIAGEGALALAEVLPQYRELRKLDLMWAQMGSDAVRPLVQSVERVEALCLAANDIDDGGIEELCVAMGCCKALTALDLSANSFTGAGALRLSRALVYCTSLHALALSDSWSVGDQGLQSLCEAAGQITTLRTLNLHGSGVGRAASEALGKAVKGCMRIQKLNLSQNGLDTAGAGWLAEGLRDKRCLAHLALVHNQITDVRVLAAALESCLSLQTLLLQSNGCGDQGATSLARVLSCCPSLTHLALSRNKIGNTGATSLASALSTRRRLSLVELDLVGNDVGDDGGRSLSEVLTAGSLVQLSLGYNPLGPEGVGALVRAMAEARSVRVLSLTGMSRQCRHVVDELWGEGKQSWRPQAEVCF